MNCFKKILAGAAVAAAAFTASAKPSVLQIAQHINDSTIVFPESVETDTHKMMQNWYIQTYTALDQNADSRPDGFRRRTDKASRSHTHHHRDAL